MLHEAKRNVKQDESKKEGLGKGASRQSQGRLANVPYIQSYTKCGYGMWLLFSNNIRPIIRNGDSESIWQSLRKKIAKYDESTF